MLPRRKPRAEEAAADANEEADVEDELADPERRRDRRVGAVDRRQVRARTRRADREHDGSTDRMAVERHDAPAQHMRALAQSGGQRNGRATRRGRSDASSTVIAVVRPHQPQHQRGYRLVEGEHELRRRRRHRRRRPADRSRPWWHARARARRSTGAASNAAMAARYDDEPAHPCRPISSAAASRPARAPCSRRPACLPAGSRSSDARRSRTPARPGSTTCGRARGRR